MERQRMPSKRLRIKRNRKRAKRLLPICQWIANETGRISKGRRRLKS